MDVASDTFSLLLLRVDDAVQELLPGLIDLFEEASLLAEAFGLVAQTDVLFGELPGGAFAGEELLALFDLDAELFFSEHSLGHVLDHRDRPDNFVPDA